VGITVSTNSEGEKNPNPGPSEVVDSNFSNGSTACVSALKWMHF
jgi:hypothetical protein